MRGGPGERASLADRRWATVAAWLVLASLAPAVPQAVAAQEAPERVQPGAPCATATCHPDLLPGPGIHFVEGFATRCVACHVPEEEGAHSFETEEETPTLCTSQCHEDLLSGETVHDPAAEDCLECHDAHRSDAPNLLVEPIQKTICFECHDEEDFQFDHEHGPVDAGECARCHDPHSSDNDHLLRRTGNELCGDCHQDIYQAVLNDDTVHDPADEDCTNCHDPHGGSEPRMLSDSGRALCEQCHDDLVGELDEAPVQHGPAVSGEQCVRCHNPHASPNDYLLRKPLVSLCLGCHRKRVKATDGTRLLNLKRWLERHEIKHKPIEEEGCTACHDPHFSENRRLLKEAFPPTRYVPFDPKRYALCFSCHDEKLAVTERTRSATGFRDGDKNLHYVHLHRDHKGRTCRLCHDFHAADNPVLVADTVRFGRWRMPIRYRKTETGGSCRPGCHEQRSYDREKR